jgi:sulfur carrier protein ThiS
MPEINLRFFGFGSRASGYDTKTWEIPAGTTLWQLWETLRSSADDKELLARIDEKNVFFLVNGKLIHQEYMPQTDLTEGDTVTLMVLAIGGQAHS